MFDSAQMQMGTQLDQTLAAAANLNSDCKHPYF